MSIGTLGERSLHASIKEWYAQPGDLLEEEIDGYVVDIVRGERLIEIQTGNFAGFRRKLAYLLREHQVHVVHPIALERTVVREGSSARRSPKHGTVYDVFDELVAIPHQLMEPNFTLEVLLVKEEIILLNDGRGSWRRRGWSLGDRCLISVEGSVTFGLLRDYKALVPSSLKQPFTAAELARAVPCNVGLAQRMVYVLRHICAIQKAGKRGRAQMYEVEE
ncbi:MAG: hypothetical protein HZB92_09280 [Euryarchaeota archaeon]|nr:hypothetical protein [Euryarchaeota archaeon]